MPNVPDQQPDPLEKSLGDQATGADVSRVDRDMSLGDQSTTGDALSSMSDISDLSDGPGDEMPVVDLSERYEIQESIGKGGMGEVLRALDKRLERPVAIKRVLGKMTRSKKALSRFLTEARSIAALNHFNIVQIHDYGRDDKGPFIIMELVEGESLQDRLKAGKLEIEEAVDITCQLCDALAVAHEQGIVHRDIKPANILLTERGEPKLTDFGLARQETADDGHTQAGVVLGTIDFMSLEQRRDATAADARSDLWSLAATLYQMLTGEAPRVLDLEQVPQNLRPVLAKSLKQNPGERYATAEDFKSALRTGLSTAAITVSLDQYLFQDNGFHGSRFDYYHRANSYLNRVIDDREGLPITLCVLYIELGQRLGLTIEGVGLPGHFIVRHVDNMNHSQLIDVFNEGKRLSREDAVKLVAEHSNQPFQDQYLEPVSKRLIVTRMLNNLMGLAQQKEDKESMLRYAELMMALDSHSVQSRGMRAILRFETGRKKSAIADLDWFLEHRPANLDLDRIEQMREMFAR